MINIIIMQTIRLFMLTPKYCKKKEKLQAFSA